MNLFNMLLSTTKKESTNKPLTFTAEEEGAVVYLRKIGTSSDLDTSGIQYRLNETDGWTPYTMDEQIILENVGDYVQFQNTNETLSLDRSNYINVSITKKVKASGNVQSMLNYSKSCKPYCYYRLFYYCKTLTEAPELPATTLAEGCYQYMFSFCTGLTAAPELPATTLANNCYSGMFYKCSNLNEVKVHFTDWNTTNTSTTYWLSGVNAEGTFICPPELPEQRGVTYIPNKWTFNKLVSK